MSEKKILILGLGNILLRDEGFGVRALEYLLEHYQWPENITLLDGGTRGLLLMSELMDCDKAFILDICHAGGKPGTIYCFSANDMDKNSNKFQSAHQTGINDILLSCELAGYSPETIIFGFEPFDYQSLSAELSDSAKQLLPEYCEKVAEELKKYGVESKKIQKGKWKE